MKENPHTFRPYFDHAVFQGGQTGPFSEVGHEELQN
jgi:hypothetical protein